jgi:hypothetical protein
VKEKFINKSINYSNMKNKLCNYLLIFAVFALAGCTNKDNAKVEKQIDKFYNAIAHKNYKEAYSFFAVGFKQEIPQKEINILLATADKLYGDFESKKQIGWEVTQQLISGNKLKIYHYRYEVHYANKTCNEEIYVMADHGSIGIAKYDSVPIEGE